MTSSFPRGKMKAQSLVFERMMIFLSGVVIFVICLGMFLNYQAFYTQVSVADQVDGIGSTIRSTIINLAKTGTETQYTVEVSVPPRIGNEDYSIEFSQLGFEIESSSGTKRMFTLFGLNETYQIDSKRVASTARDFLIYKNGNRIIIL